MTNFFIFFVEFLFGYNINIGGQISIGEIIIFIWFLTKYKEIHQSKFFQVLSKMYFFLIMAQVLSECFVSNGLNNSIRGILVSIFSLLHLTFLCFYIQKSYKCIPYILIAKGISIFIFAEIDDLNIQNMIGGEESGFVKMQLAPMIGFLLTTLSIYLKKQMNSILFLAAGMLMIVMGARSGGMFLAVTGVLGYFMTAEKKLPQQTLLAYSIIILCTIYALYVLYVNEVLSGNITSGNNHQIRSLSNPYNPFELLVRGRSEFFVGITAFFDKFLFGHGAWAMDTTRKYWTLLVKLHGEVYSGQGTPWMPVHSVILGWGVYNGILAFIAGMRIFIMFCKMAIKALKTSAHSISIYCLAYSFLNFLWNGLFSPPSHFRLTLPVYMVIIYFCYNQMKRYKRTKKYKR